MSEITLEEVVAEATKNGRVCPMPDQWLRLYELLPNRDRGAGRPSLPLILAAWHEAPPLMKMLRVREHIEWAAKQGVLVQVVEYLRGLREDQWLYL